ncbi:MAG: hypothetical protein IT375_02330 [Polyangiaceae bacterium]|nr:hypothetical protein [Polyangiaceae bacterium]
MKRLGGWLWLALAGCSAAELRGAESVPAGREPAARPLAAYRAVGCVDAAGGALPHPTRVVLVEGEAQRRMLIVSRPSYDSLLVQRSTGSGREQAFQAIVNAEGGPEVLHDYRLPVGGGGGRMAVATEFTQSPAPPGTVVAQVSRVAFACRLEPEPGAP